MRVRITVDLEPAQLRAIQWRITGSGEPASVPAFGYIRAGAVRDYLTRRLEAEIVSDTSWFQAALEVERDRED